jgi:hypothetical protein
MAAIASAEEIYERHIRPLSTRQRLELMALIASDLAAEWGTAPDRPKQKLTDLEGLGKEIWEGIDAQEYVDRLRGPWPDEVP